MTLGSCKSIGISYELISLLCESSQRLNLEFLFKSKPISIS